MSAHFIEHGRTQMLKYWDVDLLLLVCRLLDPKDERNSYWVPDYPVVFPEYLPAFQPPRSFHVVVGGRGGRVEGAFLWLASTVAQSQILSARGGLETMGCRRTRERAASRFMHGKSPLSVVFPGNLQSEYSHSRGIMNLYRLLHPSSLHSLEGKVPPSLRH